MYEKPTDTIVFNNEKLKDFPLVRNKIWMPTLTISILHSIAGPSHSNHIRKRNKITQIERE